MKLRDAGIPLKELEYLNLKELEYLNMFGEKGQVAVYKEKIRNIKKTEATRMFAELCKARLFMGRWKRW